MSLLGAKGLRDLKINPYLIFPKGLTQDTDRTESTRNDTGLKQL